MKMLLLLALKPDQIELIIPFVFLISVSIFFYFTLKKASNHIESKYEHYRNAFDEFRKKSMSSTNPKYQHILYKQIYQIRKRNRADKIVYNVASETMRFILDRIDSLPKEEQLKYAKEQHHHKRHII